MTLKPIKPSDVLWDEWIQPLLDLHWDIKYERLNTSLAKELALQTKTSPEFWINLQAKYTEESKDL